MTRLITAAAFAAIAGLASLALAQNAKVEEVVGGLSSRSVSLRRDAALKKAGCGASVRALRSSLDSGHGSDPCRSVMHFVGHA